MTSPLVQERGLPYILGQTSLNLWYRNGGDVTHEYIKHIRKSVRKEIFDYLHSLPLNIDIEVNGQPYILVHGGAIAAYHNYMISFACFTLMIGQSPATQTWTHIRRMWQHSRNVGSRRLELRR